MIQFAWEISLGQVLSTIGFLFGIWGAALRIYHMVDKRMASFEISLTQHASTLQSQTTRMGNYERDIRDIVSDVQRIVGRLEILSPRWTGVERRDRST